MAQFIWWRYGAGKMWMTVAIIGFVLLMAVGNFMAVKPKRHEVALDDLRMAARRMSMTPRLIAYPEWLFMPQHDNKGMGQNQSRGMIACYTLVNDDWSLPQAYYRAKDGYWQYVDILVSVRHGRAQHQGVQLHGASIDFPEYIMEALRGISMKSNSISLYWHDALVSARLDAQTSQALLMDIKSGLEDMVAQLNTLR